MCRNKISNKIFFLLMLFLLTPLLILFQPMTVSADTGDTYEGDQLGADPWSTSFPNTNPWEILAGGDEVVYLGGESFSGSLYTMVKQTIILFCMLGAFGCVIAIPWVNSSDGVKANKDKLIHKLLVMAGVFAVIPAFNFIKYLLDSMFGW